ncbi:MAG: hypothetical protein RR470_12115 [Vagococcus sp.]|uniref:hypothetical protein n=1 Tax=Vagococcus sp. TaxID=1933889 RepID=UPI002FCACBA6
MTELLGNNNVPDAMYHFNLGLQVVHNRMDLIGISTLNGIGYAYFMNNESEKAKFYFEKSLTQLEEMRSGDDKFLDLVECSKIYYYSAKYYSHMKEYDKSNDLLLKAIDLQKKVYKIAGFLLLLTQNFEGIPLNKITNKQVQAFEQCLQSGSRTQATNYLTYNILQDFFDCLIDFGEALKIIPIKKNNPFNNTLAKRTNKYIPKEGLIKLDHYFKSEKSRIPLELRLLYWLIQLFPNRISDLLSIDENCLIQELDMFILHVPTYKQNGGYTCPEMKKIPILYKGHGKYLIDLIVQWKQRREHIMKQYIPYKVKESNEKALFISTFWKFEEEKGHLRAVSVKSFGFDNTIKNWNLRVINTRLSELSRFFQLKDEDGVPLKITTHYFRHNAITDRIYTTRYTSEQLQKLTGHKNEQMGYYHTHPQKEHHSRLNKEIQGENNLDFMGKILQFNQFTIHQLAKSQEVYGVSDMMTEKGLGVCSSMKHCQPNGIPNRFCCYFCEYFVPEARFIDCYVNELVHWEESSSRLNSSKQELNERERSKMIQAVSISQHLISIMKQANLSRKGDQPEATKYRQKREGDYEN